MNKYRARAYVYLLITALVWGVASPVIKFTLGEIDPLPFLTYRFALSAVVALPFLIKSHHHLPRTKSILLMLLVYAFVTSTVVLGLIFFGLQKTTVLDMTLIATVGPLLVAVAGVKFLNEHITRREKFGISIALVGVIVTVVEPLVRNGNGTSALSGNIFILFYLVFNVLSVVLLKKLLRHGVDALYITSMTFVVGFLTLTPIAFFVHGQNLLPSISQISLPSHLGVIYMAIFSGNIAYFLWAKGQKSIETGEAALFGYLGPLFAAPLAVYWLGEKITTPFIVGAILITAGVITAEYKKRR